ncbi:MAG: PHP-associated domain-containing protein, partial [Actinomycetota bacterium]
APHPASLPTPPGDALRRDAAAIDCHEFVTAGAHGAGRRAAALARRMGILAVAGSGASTPDEVGVVAMRVRPFGGREDLLDALADADIVRLRRPLIPRAALPDRPTRKRD